MAIGAVGCRAPDLWVDPARCDANKPVDPDTLAPATYHEHIRPIVEKTCLPCHAKGGIGPFGLETYDQVQSVHVAMAASVAANRMPPWKAGPCCRTYKHDTSLTPHEKALIANWSKAGAAEGDPTKYKAPTGSKTGVGLSKADVSISNPPYSPTAAFGADELRCFLLDWPFDDARFVTGFNVVPGNKKIVHHALLNVISPAYVDHFKGLDAADDGPGWDCYGQGLSAAHGAGIGGWAPGFTGLDYPGGLGIKVEAGAKLLMAVHYDLSGGSGVDTTTAEFGIAKTVTREVVNMGFSHPLWLIGEGMYLPAGHGDVMHSFAYDPTSTVGSDGPLKVYAVNMHMHDLGKRVSIAIDRADGSRECLLYIPQWDADWQQSYFLEEPAILQPGDRLYLECHWDNSVKNQTFVPGVGKKAKSLWWGSDKEMCTAFVMMAKP